MRKLHNTVLIGILTVLAQSGSLSCSGATASVQGGDITSASGLPVPPVTGVHKPVGALGGLKVLNWAGFKSAITYTFDDSIQSQIANYPQLQATGVRMTFFIVGANNDSNSPVWSQAAKDGHELANHTAHHCHANGAGCGWGSYAGTLEQEYDLCTDHIKQAYGVSNVWTTASPYGDTGYNSIAKTRFFLNRGVWSGQIAPNDNTDPYNLLVHAVVAGETASSYNSFIDSAHTAGNWQIFLFHSLGRDNGYAPVNIADLLASIHHAQSMGDVWIDSMVNVGAYWAGQKVVTNAASTKSGKNTIVTWKLPDHFPPGKYIRVTVTGGTLKQQGKVLPWNDAGYYEVALDAGSLTISR